MCVETGIQELLARLLAGETIVVGYDKEEKKKEIIRFNGDWYYDFLYSEMVPREFAVSKLWEKVTHKSTSRKWVQESNDKERTWVKAAIEGKEPLPLPY